uniref:Uncharacterized LOC105237394 n=1 Tax=Ailuropoda melanoleuca TaxID=9646 RepID=A0A7N5KBI5_AILME
MLTTEEPTEPAETGRLEEDGGPGADPEDTAVLSGEDSQAKQMLGSQSALGKMLPLSTDEEILLKHAGRRSHSATVIGQRQSSKHGPSSQPVRMKTEGTESGETRSCEAGDETLSGSLQDRRTVPPSRGVPSAESPAALVDGQSQAQVPWLLLLQDTRRSSQSLQEPSGHHSPEPAADVIRLKEGSPAPDENSTCSLPCKGPEGGLLTPEKTDGSARSLPGTAEPQDPPGEPGPSCVDAEIKQGHKEEERRPPAGEVAQALGDGREAITFSKGTGKDQGASKKTTVLRFLNGDVKKILPDQRVVYYYADAQITRTTYPNGLAIVRFPNKQTEKYHPDGSKEIVFPDGTVKRLSAGREKTVFPDGTVVSVERSV